MDITHVHMLQLDLELFSLGYDQTQKRWYDCTHVCFLLQELISLACMVDINHVQFSVQIKTDHIEYSFTTWL